MEEVEFNIRCRGCRAVLHFNTLDVHVARTSFGKKVKRFVICPHRSCDGVYTFLDDDLKEILS